MELSAGRISFLDDDPDKGEARIHFVGGAFRRYARAFKEALTVNAIDNLIEEAALAASAP